jgi:subfamily B ATP-binding cassette protein MsbA
MKSLWFVFQFGWPYLRRYRSRFLAGVFLGILFGLSHATFPWAIKTMATRFSTEPEMAAEEKSPSAPNSLRALADGWSQRAEASLDAWLPLRGRPLDSRQWIGGLLLLPSLVLLRGVLSYGSGYSMKWVGEHVVNDLRCAVYAKISSLSLEFFHRMKSGDLLGRVTTDTKALYLALNFGLSDLVKEPITLATLVLSMLWIDPQLTLFTLVFMPLCIIPLLVLGRKVRKAGQAIVKADVKMLSNLIENVEAMKIIKAFGLEDYQLRRFREFARQRLVANMTTYKAEELSNPIIEITAALAISSVVVFVIATGRDPGDFVAFLGALALSYTPVKKLAQINLHFQKARAAVDRIESTFAETPAVREIPDAPKTSGLQNGIQIESVELRYTPESVSALRGVSFEIRPGEKIGLAGESGSGKSSLLHLIARFYDPTSGHIRWNGRDLRDWELASLRRQMALVSQETVLFDGTVAENIALGHLGTERGRIEEAAHMAFAHDFISSLPQGYETPLGERGVRLSGGQRQRLAIARAFVRNAPVLLLDEATAALDSNAEAEVQAAIDRLAENRTVLCVAHRLSTLKNMDRVYFFDRGLVTESGAFAELVAQGGRFASLCRAQGIQI